MSEGFNLNQVNELHVQRFDWTQAFGKTLLELRIGAWPSGWGDDLHILIYGDFEPPSEDIHLPELGITINHVNNENTVIKSARCVLEAVVTIEDKSPESLIDASRRINILLGAWTLFKLGDSAIGWWSYVTHGTTCGVLHKLEADNNLDRILTRILNIPNKTVREKVEAALYWMREPRNLLLNSYRSDLLRIYSAYWNAFECLVDAVNEIKPEPKVSKSAKEMQINEFITTIKARNGKLTSEDIIECYGKIINPGFKAKASHALIVCFPKDAARFINECFDIPEKSNRLYKIRNAIDHGDIDAENPEELYRVGLRLTLLDTIVRYMFRQIILLSLPVQEAQNDPTPK
jgi:hypothetical protein